MQTKGVIVIDKVSKKDLLYQNEIVLSYTIKYPNFLMPSTSIAITEKCKQFINQLNMYYSIKTVMYEKYHINQLYQMAIENYEYSKANNYPVRKYEVYTTFTVTYNQDCILSLYTDQYEYTGGAHGMTKRMADSWDLIEAKRIELSDLFPGRKDYKEYSINTIMRQIEKDIASENNFYFENYAELVKENFDSKNFYLTEEGVVIYFDLYEIAPYASGILTFTIPYSEEGPTLPHI